MSKEGKPVQYGGWVDFNESMNDRQLDFEPVGPFLFNEEELPSFLLTPHQQSRAIKVLQLAKTFGYPPEIDLKTKIDAGELRDCDLSGSDVTNAFAKYGPSLEHISGTSNASSKKVSTREPASRPGENFALDLKKFSSPTIGGGHEALISCDENTGYLIVVIMPSKDTKEIKIAESVIINTYNQYQFRVGKFNTDHEATLLKSSEHVKSTGIEFDAAVPRKHQTTVERAIQTIEKK